MKSMQFAFAILLIFIVAAPAGAITFGQVDDFQDLSTQNWTSGLPNPNPPINANNAGPSGGGDHALQVSANGSGGAGGLLVTFNTSQWLGNYTANGVSKIRFDANNVGPNPVSLGFQINNGSAITFDTGVISPGSGWNSYEISLTSLAFGSTTNLTNVTDFRLRYIQGGTFIGGVVAEVQVDNIRAVPEPSALAIASWLAVLAGLRRPRRAPR